MPQLAGGGDPELCATDEMIPFKDEGDPQKEQIFAEISHSEEEGDLADIKSSLVNESETSPNSNSHDVSILMPCVAWWNFFFFALIFRSLLIGKQHKLLRLQQAFSRCVLLVYLDAPSDLDIT